MFLTVVALIQSAAALPPEAISGMSISANRCDPRKASSDEVLIFGRRDSQSPYRIGPQSELPPALPNAEFKLVDGVGLKLHSEGEEIGGAQSNRAMVSLKIRF
jgi:hypothetical protein